MDKSFLKFIIKDLTSDIIFNQHMRVSSGLNAIIIIIETILVVIGILISTFTNIVIMPIVAFVVIILTILVIINSYIQNKAWEMAKKSLKSASSVIDGYIDNFVQTKEDK